MKINDRMVDVVVIVLICATVFVASPRTTQATERLGDDFVAPSLLPPVLTDVYRINVGDVLSIDFFKTTEFSQTITVGPDGAISLPLVGRIVVVGRTVEDVTAELMEGFGREMVNPQITVSIEEYSGLSVYVAGEVVRPGEIEYHGGLTLVQAIFDAGGFNRRARRQEVLVIRPGADLKPVGTIVDVKEILRKGQIKNDFELAPMDIVYVHHKRIVNVNIFVEQYISDNLPRFGSWMYYFPGYGD
jgi:protein involved in polysaccharide export with SLBB domain